MTLILTESFDGIAAGSDNIDLEYLDAKHGGFISGVAARQGGCVNNSSGATAQTGRHGQALRFWAHTNLARSGRLTTIIPSSEEDDTVVVGFAHYGTAAGQVGICDFGEIRNSGGSAVQTYHVQIVQAGADSTTFQVWGGAGTSLGTFQMPLNIWKYVEVKVRVHDTTGFVVVRVDGVEVFNMTNIDTKGTHATVTGLINFVEFRADGGAGTTDRQWFMDDYYLLNEQGSAPFNDFLGDVAIQYLQPSGAGSSTAWTPSAGSNWDCVSEPVTSVAPQTSDYVSSSTVDAKDEYALADTTFVSPSVPLAVALYAYADKDDTGARSLALISKLGANENQSGDLILRDSSNGGPQYVKHIQQLNPAGAAWSISDLNSLEIGVVVR